MQHIHKQQIYGYSLLCTATSLKQNRVFSIDSFIHQFVYHLYKVLLLQMLQNATFFPLPHGSQNQIKCSLTEMLLVMKNEGESWRKLVYRKKIMQWVELLFKTPLPNIIHRFRIHYEFERQIKSIMLTLEPVTLLTTGPVQLHTDLTYEVGLGFIHLHI